MRQGALRTRTTPTYTLISLYLIVSISNIVRIPHRMCNRKTPTRALSAPQGFSRPHSPLHFSTGCHILRTVSLALRTPRFLCTGDALCVV